MIITSNSVTHEYTIPNLSIIGEVNGLENVAYKAQIYLHSSTTFPYTYETNIFDIDSQVGITTTVTEEKTVTEFTLYDIELNTVGIASSTFTPFDNLEEDQVLQWCFDTEEVFINRVQNDQEQKVLTEKDKILNPKKYYRGTPVTPWRSRRDQESIKSL